MKHICPNCNHENLLDIEFNIIQYVCSNCHFIIEKNKKIKIIEKPALELKINQKGVLFGIEYTITGIVIKKHLSFVIWKEYNLIDAKGNKFYLSEYNGHWVFFENCIEKVIYSKNTAIYKGINYRWYEDTVCVITHADGFFDAPINLKKHMIYEYVNGQAIISTDDHDHDYYGIHISRHDVKKGFSLSKIPAQSGIGIIQPYYFDKKSSLITIVFFALVMSVIQIYVHTTRTNHTVFNDRISTFESSFDENVTKSFTLIGGAAPLVVEAKSDIYNNWANIEIGLVNEKNNEIQYANKDIEYYKGVQDGENWTEGSQDCKFNFCAIPEGKYHLIYKTSIENFKEYRDRCNDSVVFIDNNVIAKLKKNNQIEMNIITFADTNKVLLDNNYKTDNFHFNLAKRYFESNNKSKILIEILSQTLKINSNQDGTILLKIEWKPITYRNFIISIFLLLLVFIIIYFGNYFFESKKWENSTNSPFIS
jgi:hypothetical protein